ncbi:MAG: sarcosine oxidase subunit beta family protein [Cohaesibacteraceae bacterium]|nr:sarcosine oxidase subunit beta family protein [Cohaesibacteraceae bacterium]MBL4876179.1 sarcosine oxidase subunit beta family protein [Cohaesibacteraceae bacterium]
MQKYSLFSLLKHGFKNHSDWKEAWRKPEPKSHYDVVIIGAGGHGLATAWYLASKHGIKNVAVLEKNWLGGGNTGRNTTVIRSNYLHAPSIAIYEHSRKLYETLSASLNFNIMFSARGLLSLSLSEQEHRSHGRIFATNRVHGVQSALLSPREVRKKIPLLADGSNDRFHLHGALYQSDAGTARHDAVAWGFARAADSLGVDIIENCTVEKIVREENQVTGVETSRGLINTKKIAVVAAGDSDLITQTAGLRLPIECTVLQALVSEPLKSVLNSVVVANALDVYINQSDKGELVIGGRSDRQVNYSRRGNFQHLEDTIGSVLTLFPSLSRLAMLRHWGGTIDLTPDNSPIIGLTDINGLYVNCGWGSGGFKAIPGSGDTFADTIANNRPHPLVEPFGLHRFQTGQLIDESAATGVAH